MLRNRFRNIFGLNSFPIWLRALAFGVAYFLSAMVGSQLSPAGSKYVSFWLPAGLYVAGLLLNARRNWHWLALAALPANLVFDLTHGTIWWLGLIFYVANTVQAVIGAWLVRRFVVARPTLGTVKEFVGLLAFAGILATLPGAVIGAGGLCLAGLSDSFLQSTKVWWGSCALAVLLFSPLVLVWCSSVDALWHGRSQVLVRPRRMLEGALLFGGLIFSTWFIFVTSEGVTTPYKFRTLPFLLWAGLRFGRRGAATANFIYATLVVYSAGHSQGISALPQLVLGDAIFTVQTFLVVSALVGLIPAITLAERDATLAKLLESEAHYRNLTDAAFEGVCISENGRILDVNDQFVAMFGGTREQLIGSQILDLIAPESREMVAAALRSGRESLYGHRLVRRDGSFFHGEARAKMVRMEGRTLRTTALRDITERIEAEEALRKSEARLRALSDNFPNGLVYQTVREPDGTMKFLHLSAGVERIHGVTAEAIIRDPQVLYVQIPEDDKARLFAAEVRSFAEMSVFNEIIRVRRGDGQVRWVHLCSAPRRLTDGRVVWDGIEIDITESKRAEEALRLSEEKYSKAFLSSPSAILITRQSDGTIVETNETFCRWFDIAPETARGRNMVELGVWNSAAEREAMIRQVRRVGAIRNLEKEILPPSGRRMMVFVSMEQITIRGEECLLTVAHDITDLKQAQRALQENEMKFRTLFNTASDAIFIMDGPLILDCNDKTEVMFGSPRAEIIGRSPVDFSPEKQAGDIPSTARAEKKIAAVLGGQPQFFEWVHRRRDGTLFDAEVSLNRVELGGRFYLQAIVRDITARKQAEVRLRTLTERLKLATVAAAIAVWEWNLQTNEVQGDERLFEMYGQPVDPSGRFSYEQWTRQVHPDDLPEQMAALQKTIATKGQGVREFRAFRLDGALRHIQAAEIVLTNEHGEANRVVGVNLDITERKCAEEALRENQRMLTTLMANLPGLVYRCQNDADWTMEFVSEGCFALTGYRPADLLHNKATSFGQLIHPEDRELVTRMVRSALDRHGVFEMNYRIRTAGGQEKWMWERGQGVYGADGTFLALEGFITDVTAQHRAEAEREAATKREQAARDEFTRQLIASQEAERTRIAREIHDHLGQLLTALKLDLRSLERRASVLSDADLKTALIGKINSAKELADETITSVQKIASELRPGILDRLGLAAAIEVEAQAFESRTGVRCACVVPRGTVEIPPDRAMAAFRIFQEIITNVARHAHATEVSIKLAVTAQRLELIVVDNGVGVEDQHFKNSKSLGLLGMRERAEILGGQIEFRKPPEGSGTVVAVGLPLQGPVEANT